MAGETASLKLKSDQLSSHAPKLLSLERSVTGEGTALVELHDPAEARFQRRGGVVDFVSVQSVAHLQSERVTGAETDRLGAGLEERGPDLHRVPLPAVQLEAVFSGVAGAGDEALGARHPADDEVVVRDV